MVNHRIIAYTVKLFKEKFRSPIFLLWIILWPTILVSLAALTPVDFLINKISDKGFFNLHALPSAGIGPFTFDLLCNSNRTMNYSNINQHDYNLSSYKVISEYLKKMSETAEIKYYLNLLLTSYLQHTITLAVLLKQSNQSEPIVNNYNMLNEMIFAKNFTKFDKTKVDEYLRGIEFSNSENTPEYENTIALNNLGVSLLKLFKNDIFLEASINIASIFLNETSLDNVTGKLCREKLNDKLIKNVTDIVKSYILYLDIIFGSLKEINITYEVTYIPKYGDYLNMTYGLNMLNKNYIAYAPDNEVVRKIVSMVDLFWAPIKEYFKLIYLNDEKLTTSYYAYIEMIQTSKYNNTFYREFYDGLVELYAILITNPAIPLNSKIFKDPRIIKNIVKNDTFYNDGPYAGVIFKNINNGSDPLKNIQYSITMLSLILPDVSQYYYSMVYTRFELYLQSFWSYLQDIVDISIMKVALGSENISNSAKGIKSSPSSCMDLDKKFSGRVTLIPTVFSYSLIAALMFISRYFIIEKELKIHDFLLTTGISIYSYIGYILFIDILICVISFIPTIFLLKVGLIIKYTNFIVIFALIVGLILSCYSLCLLLITLCSNASVSSITIGLMTIVFLLPHFLIRFNMMSYIPKWIHILCSLLPHTAFSEGLYKIIFIEMYRNEGVSLETFNSGYNLSSEMSLMFYVLILYFDAVFYIALTVFVNQNLKQTCKNIYSYARKSWNYFRLHNNFHWYTESNRNNLQYMPLEDVLSDQISNESTNLSEENLSYHISEHIILQNEEVNHTNLTDDIAVSIEHVTLSYGDEKNVLNDICLKICHNRIYTLLGENGSGKSTLIKAIIGDLKCKSGSITITEKSQGTNKRSIGYCPQHEVLIGKLTVLEHLYFYWRIITNTSPKNAESIFNSLLSKMDLFDKRNTLTNNLSGGQKRKLSVGIAFLGNPSLVILDEPTAGIDPESRRGVWDLIFKSHSETAILLSTHHMDEADIFCENIIIISDGKILINSNAVDLKNKYGDHSKLTIIKKNSNQPNENIIKFITENIPDSKVFSEKNNSIIFSLPKNFKKNDEIDITFDKIYSKKDELEINALAFNDPTMDNTFINIYKEHKIEVMGKEIEYIGHGHEIITSQDIIINEIESQLDTLLQDISEVPKPPNIPKTIFMNMKKRFQRTMRDKSYIVTQLLVPFIVPLISCAFDKLILLNHMQPVSLSMDGVTKIHPLMIPIQHSHTTNASCMNPILNFVINNDENILKNPHWNKNISGHPSSNYGFHDYICAQNVNRACTYRNTSWSIIEQSYNSSILYKSSSNKLIEFDWIGDCDLDHYFDITQKKLPLRRYFALNFSSCEDFLDNTGSLGIKIIVVMEGIQSIPISINYVNNMIYKANAKLLNKTDFNSYSIEVINDPILFTTGYNALIKLIASGNVIIFLSLGMSLSVAFFTLNPLEEQQSGFKKIQKLLGLNEIIYWLSMYIADMILFSFSIFVTMMIFLVFSYDDLSSKSTFFLTSSTLFIFGFSAIPISYIISSSTRTKSSAYVIQTLIGFILVFYTVFMEGEKDNPDFIDNEYKNLFYNIMAFIPYYSLATNLHGISTNYNDKVIYEEFGIGSYKTFSYDFIGKELMLFVIVGIILFIIHVSCILMIDKVKIVYRNLSNSLKNFSDHDTDSDILDEKTFCDNDANETNSVLVLRNLHKLYNHLIPSKKNHAVKGINFAIRTGECFGFLGTNGAGKSTTFRMIVGETVASYGDIKFFNLGPHIPYSYCPQIDNLDMLLTPSEHIGYFCSLYGYSKNNITNISENLISLFRLEEYKNKIVKNLSFGNRRKLSSLLCLIGNPNLILMDEPTTGMDPPSRSLIYDIIKDLAKAGKSILFTTHSVNECESNCERLAIIVKGRIQCIGTPTHIKEKFGNGYELSVKCPLEMTEHIKAIVHKNWINSKIIDSSLKYVTFFLPIVDRNLAEIFELIKSIKSQNIDFEFTLSQSGLENIFRNFAKNAVCDT